MSYTVADYVRDYIKEEIFLGMILEDRLMTKRSPAQLQALSLDEALKRFTLGEVLLHWPFEEVLQKNWQDHDQPDLSLEEVKAYLLKIKSQQLTSHPVIFLSSWLSQLSPEERLQALMPETPEQQLPLSGFTPEQCWQGFSPAEKEHRRNFLHDLLVVARLAGLSPNEVLQRFFHDDVVRRWSPDEVLQQFSLDEIEAYLSKLKTQRSH